MTSVVDKTGETRLRLFGHVKRNPSVEVRGVDVVGTGKGRGRLKKY